MMNSELYQITLVSEFCNQLASTEKGIRRMRSWYVFSDKRPGAVLERFGQDAKSYFDYERMFRI
jgi:hypothetical protein